MDQEYEVKSVDLFQNPKDLGGDLYYASRRAKMLAWALDELAAYKFSTTADNEWLWDLSRIFLGVIGRDLQAASDLAEQMQEDASHGQTARSAITVKQVALIHVAKRQLGLDDDSYRAILQACGRVDSAADLDAAGFHAVMAYFTACGFRSTWTQRTFGKRHAMASPQQVDMIHKLWLEWSGSDDASALNKWIERSYHVSALRFLDAATSFRSKARIDRFRPIFPVLCVSEGGGCNSVAVEAVSKYQGRPFWVPLRGWLTFKTEPALCGSKCAQAIVSIPAVIYVCDVEAMTTGKSAGPVGWAAVRPTRTGKMAYPLGFRANPPRVVNSVFRRYHHQVEAMKTGKSQCRSGVPHCGLLNGESGDMDNSFDKPLPGILGDIESVAGRDIAEKICAASGGRLLNFPAVHKLTANSRLSKIVGYEAALRICTALIPSIGSRIEIPLWDGAFVKKRRTLVRQLILEGKSVADVASQA
eukprot:gene21832-22807_t